jgi:hypothetical protein
LLGKSSGFLYQRLKPGVILTVSRGRDTGEFGDAPLEIIERERRLFDTPVHWFFDASQVENPTRAVSGHWTAWLRKHAEALAQMNILTGSAETHLMIEIARHFSDASNRMKLHTDRAEWEKTVLRATPGLAVFPNLFARFDESAIPISRSGAGVSAPGCAWTFRLLGADVIYSAFQGDDVGDLTDAALDEMERLLHSGLQKMSWFMDLRDAHNVTANVSQTWTEWLAARQHRFSRVTAYAPSPLFPLVLTVAKYRSGTEHLFRIHRELGPFRRDLIGATSGEVAASVGV